VRLSALGPLLQDHLHGFAGLFKATASAIAPTGIAEPARHIVFSVAAPGNLADIGRKRGCEPMPGHAAERRRRASGTQQAVSYGQSPCPFRRPFHHQEPCLKLRDSPVVLTGPASLLVRRSGPGRPSHRYPALPCGLFFGSQPERRRRPARPRHGHPESAGLRQASVPVHSAASARSPPIEAQEPGWRAARGSTAERPPSLSASRSEWPGSARGRFSMGFLALPRVVRSPQSSRRLLHRVRRLRALAILLGLALVAFFLRGPFRWSPLPVRV